MGLQASVSSVAQLCLTLQPAARQASLAITNSQSLLKLMSIELVMPSNHLILSHPLLLLLSVFASIRVFSNESVLCIRWPKYWSFSFNMSPTNEHTGLISFRMIVKQKLFWYLLKMARKTLFQTIVIVGEVELNSKYKQGWVGLYSWQDKEEHGRLLRGAP